MRPWRRSNDPTSMAFDEHPLLFRCDNEQLLGIVAAPPSPVPTGVLIVVGGPQYRAGSHRQFVHLARRLAEQGIACMRFDYRGMGDASGAMRSFEDISADIRAAIDGFFANCPHLRTVALWGLCDGASAACFYANTDPRVSAVVLVNPWVRTDAGLAQVHLRHYYIQRLFSRDFWRKLLRGSVSSAAATGFMSAVRLAVRGRTAGVRASAASPKANASLPEQMALALLDFRGSMLVILSGDDY